MKKIFSFMLMATALLISGNAGATTLTVGTVESGATYQDLSSAITAAAADDEIQLLSDVDFAANTAINKSLTIDLNGKTLKQSVKSKYVSVGVKSKVITVTIKNGIISDGGLAASTGLLYINTGNSGTTLALQNVTVQSPTAVYPIYNNVTGAIIKIDSDTELNGKSGLFDLRVNTTINNAAQLEGVINAVGSKTITWNNVDGGSLTLTGGYVPASMTSYTLASGKKTINTYHATYLASKQIVADDAEIVATQVNGDVTYEYVSMATAIPAAKVGSKTIVMQRDADLTAAATMVAGSTLDLNGFTLRPTATAAVLTCNAQDGVYTIKNGKIDAGEIKPAQLISIASKTGITLNLEDVDLVNEGKYDIYATIASSTLNFDVATTFSAATAEVYASVKNSTTSPLTINPPTGQENDYVMTNVAAGAWRMVKIADAKFTVTDEENTTYHSVWGEALYDAKLAAGKTLKMLDDVTLTAAATLHNGTLDMNEHAISINGNYGITCCPADNAEVTIKNGTISTTATKTAAALLVNAKTEAQVSLQNVKVSAPSYYPIQLNTASMSNTLTIDADCELTGKTYAMYIYDACTPTINNYATLTQNIYATDGPSLTINNYGTIPGLSFSKTNAKNHTINNYTGGSFVFNPNQTLSGQVTLHNEGSMDIQKIVSNMVITGNGTFKLVSGSYVNIDLPAATYNLSEGTIIRAEDLQDVGAAPEGLKWLNPTMYGGIAAYKLVKADAETVCKIGDYEYISLADAVAAVPTDGTETKIEMIKDEELNASVTIANNKNIVLELNGKVIRMGDDCKSAMIVNNGTLIVQDATDYLVPVLDAISLQPMEGIQQYRGNGTGKITCSYSNPDLKGNPTVTSNAITNKGSLYVKSGWIENLSDGQASYAIDNQGTGKVYISGGKISSNQSLSIRIYNPNSQSIEITGGEIYKIWVQDGTAASNVASLSITNATLTQGLLIGYNNKIENFTLTIDNCIVGDYIIYELPAVETNELVLNNCKSGALYMTNPRSVLTNGLYQFHKEVGLGWCYVDESEEYKLWYGEEAWKAKGVRIAYDEQHSDPTYAKYYQGYLSAEAHLHNFYDYIIQGYGLVARPDIGPNWYEVRPTSGTTGEESGIYGELGNPWHQDKTWDLSETDVVPVETTPVLIDHNVYVEKDAKAEAASVIVKPEQTLTVKEGATLIVGDGGIVFNNEDGKTPGKIVIEPGATLLDGANGIISEDTKNVVIQASETAQGTFLFDPEVSLNTHPFGTVELISRSGLRKYPNGQLVNYWHRFASPVMELKEENFTNDWDSYSAATGLQIAAGTYFQTQIFQWSSSLYDWQRIDNKTNYCDSIVPFQGYTMLNNCTWDNTHKGGVTYIFRGNLVGNHNDDLSFLSNGYNYFGNSYTAPINIKELLAAVDNDDINRTIYIWDAELQVFRGWSFEQLLYVDDETTPASVPSMQTFVMQLLEGNSATSHIDYVNAIWNPVVSAVKTVQAPKREKQQVLDATLKINITAANGEKDAVVMMKDARYSNELDNGADTEKYMNEGSINMYAHADFANVSTLADAEIEGTMLSISSNDETDYLMTFSCVSGEQYAIKDHVTGTVVTISNGDSYAFSTKANSIAENRFEIIALRKMPTDMEHVKVNAAVKGIYSITGQYIGQSQDWFRLPAGVYVMDGNKVVK